MTAPPGAPCTVDAACRELAALHAAAVAADRAVALEPTRVTVDAALTAHRAHDAACETFRHRYYPRAGRVVAVFGEVFTVSPGGRRIVRVWADEARADPCP